MKINVKILDISMLLGAAAAIIFSAGADFTKECEKMQDTAFRLHILANSDSETDQNIKYALRDYILDDLGYIFSSADTKDGTVELAKRNLDFIEVRANEFLAENGCGYTAECYVEKTDFPTRKYGDYTLPAGKYDALRIILGNGEGRNWWCVLYPSVCLPAASEEKPLIRPRPLYSAQKRSYRLTAESLAIERGEGVEMKFWIYEFFKNIFDSSKR